MRYKDFAGRSTSVIALGCDTFGSARPEALSFEMMDAYVEMGGNFLDTARLYGSGLSEKTVGKWVSLRHNRDDLVIGTKGGHPPIGSMHLGRLDRAELEKDMSESLDALQMEGVDIYWLHRDDVSRPVGDILETLNLFVQRGQTKLLGASNWSAVRMAEANAYAAAHGMQGFYADQPQFSLAKQMVVEDPTLVQMDAAHYAFHAETGMPCVSFSSQAKGFFSKWAEGGEEALNDKVRRRFLFPENMEIYEKLCKLSAETGYSVGALSLAYLTSQTKFDTFPIAGASSMKQLEALREAGDAALTPEQVDWLRWF